MNERMIPLPVECPCGAVVDMFVKVSIAADDSGGFSVSADVSTDPMWAHYEAAHFGDAA